MYPNRCYRWGGAGKLIVWYYNIWEFGPASTVPVGPAEVVLMGWCLGLVMGGHSVLGIPRR